MIVDFSDAPTDAIERLLWLSGAKEAFDKELTAAFQKAYFEARQTGRLDAALNLRIHSHKRVMAFTRAENERTGRQWRWNDGR
jgi:hypothetical protein